MAAGALTGLATKARRTPLDTVNDREPQPTEADLRARLAAVEVELAGLEETKRQHEALRDGAIRQIDGVMTTDGTRSAMTLWQAEEARDRATDAINELLRQTRPLNTERQRLMSYCAPIDALRREIADAEDRVAVAVAVRSVLPAVDEVLARISAIEAACAGTRHAMPAELRRLVQKWHDDPAGRGRLDSMGTARSQLIYVHNVDDAQAAVDRLRGRLA